MITGVVRARESAGRLTRRLDTRSKQRHSANRATRFGPDAIRSCADAFQSVTAGTGCSISVCTDMSVKVVLLSENGRVTH